MKRAQSHFGGVGAEHIAARSPGDELIGAIYILNQISFIAYFYRLFGLLNDSE